MGILRAFISVLFCAFGAASVYAQGVPLQGGPWTDSHVPMYVGSGQEGSQPVIQDSGSAASGGPGVGLSELNITSRAAHGVTTAPYANSGNGPLSTHACMYDGPATSSAGYHYLCFDPNSQGGGLIVYGAAGSASALPFYLNINGIPYPFPGTGTGDVVGPSSSTIDNVACWNNALGVLLKDCGFSVSASAGEAIANPINASGGLVGYSGALGTPTQATLTNATGLPIATGLTGAGTGVLSAMGNALNGSDGLLGYSLIGTSGAALCLLNGAQCTFSNGAALGSALNGGNILTVGKSTNSTDTTQLGNSWITNILSNVGTSTPGSATESGLFVSALVNATSSAASYEKNALFAKCATNDPSNTSTPITRDCDGALMTGEIISGNMTGRAWGANSYAKADSGGEGYLTSFEADTENDTGTDATTMNASNTKVGVSAVALGTNISTSGFVLAATAGAKWENGIFVYDASIASSGYVLRDDGDNYYMDTLGRIALGTTPAYPDVYHAKFATGNVAIQMETGDTSDVYQEYDHTGSFAWQAGLHGADNSFDIAYGGGGLGSNIAFQLTSSGAPVMPKMPTSCTGQASGTLWNNSNVVNICP